MNPFEKTIKATLAARAEREAQEAQASATAQAAHEAVVALLTATMRDSILPAVEGARQALIRAGVPALRGVVAYGATPEKAVREVAIAAELWLAAAAKHGKTIPTPDASLERLASMAPVLNMAAVARESGISPQTLASKLQRGSSLSPSERVSIGNTLGSYGIRA